MQEIDVILTVNGVKDVPFCYPFCIICLCKIHPHKNQRWNCAHCGNWQRESKVQHRYRLVFNVTDYHRLADVTVFGNSLENMFGESADQFNKFLVDLESVLFKKELSVKQVLMHAVQQVFCGSTFCFTFSVPRTHSKSQIQMNLKWLGTRITGSLIAKRISFARSDCEEHPTIKGAIQYLCEKLSLKENTIYLEACLWDSSYFSIRNEENSARKAAYKFQLHSSAFCESVEFFSPGVIKLDVPLSESELTRNQNLEHLEMEQTSSVRKSAALEVSQCEGFLQGSLCSPSMNILLSSTPLSGIGSTTKNVMVKNLYSMSSDSKHFKNYDDSVINSIFGKNNAKIDQFNEDGSRRHKKCFKELLQFYHPFNDKSPSHCTNSDCLVISPSTNDDSCCQNNAIILKSTVNPMYFEKSVETSLMPGQIDCSSLMTDSALSPDIFR